MILEGVVTTINTDGSVNISPMGPLVDSPSFKKFTLRPFQTSTTYGNLKRKGQGVLHVTDDVLLIAQAAIGKLNPQPATIPAEKVEGAILSDACRWFAFQVDDLDDADERTTIQCSIVDRGRIRDFFGFCRAKHAVVEAAILATRVGILSATEIADGLARLKMLVEKTGSSEEHRAFELLQSHVEASAK